MSEIKVNKISPRTACGTTTLGDSGDTFTIPAGVTITNSGTAAGFGATGAASWDTTVKTTGFTAVSGVGYFVNTTAGAISVNLPAGTAGDVVAIKDYANTFDTYAVTLVQNGSDKIGGSAVNATLLVEGLAVTLVFIDATQGWLVTDSGLQSESPTARYVTATGGTITTSGDYKIHSFTGPGTLSVSSAGNASGSNTVDYMVVAGGGGGFGANGANSGGGGGAGGFRETTGCGYTSSPLGAGVPSLPVSATGYPIVVGGGGAGSVCNATASTGSNSSGLSITSAGGGAGAPSQPQGPAVGNDGGSGSGAGGGAPGVRAGGAGNTPPVSPSQGSNGGARPSPTGPDHQSGGGGGATAVGTAACASPLSGVGGTGATTSIIASPTAYAGGGGGSGYTPQFPAAPGLVGNGSSCGTGGSGAVSSGGGGTAEAGTTNRGGGGGAASGNSGSGDTGGAGGSGIVVIRYKFQ